MPKGIKENWEKEFDEKFEIFVMDEKEVFPCEGGYCDTSVEYIKSFIRHLLSQEKQKSFQDGKLNGYLEACQELKRRIKKVGRK